jgi:hypothetical protein
MRRHRSIGLLAGTLLALALAGVAVAKGETIAVTLDKPPTDPHAGAPITLGVKVAFPDGAPASGESVRFTLSQIGGNALVAVGAHEAEPGHYVASITLPKEGGYTVNVTATAEGMTQTFQPTVIRMLAPLPTTTPTTPAAPSAPAWVLILALILLAAAAGTAGRIIAVRRRATVAADRA